MRTISLKINDNIITRIETNLEKYNYSTLSEFIRDAIRDKLETLENQKFESEIRDYLHKNPKNGEVEKTTKTEQEQLEKAKHDIFVELERKFQELREHLDWKIAMNVVSSQQTKNWFHKKMIGQ